MIKSLLEIYNTSVNAIFEYFEYVETWEKFIISDETEYYWFLCRDQVVFSEHLITKELLEEGDYYSNEIISDEIYSKPDFTMIKVDTNTDGNCFLSIFDNSKQFTNAKIIEYYKTGELESD